MGVTVTPPVAANLADNPKNRLYRATQSGTYSVNIPVGVYEVTRQATTNIIIGSTTIVPSTIMSLIFVNEPQTSITFNSTVSSSVIPWVDQGAYGDPEGYGAGQVYRVYYTTSFGVFVHFPGDGRVYYNSTNGVNWSRSRLDQNWSGGSTRRQMTTTADSAGRVAHAMVGTNQSTHFICWSTNALNWNRQQVGFQSTWGSDAIARGIGRYVLGGRQGSTGIIQWVAEANLTNTQAWEDNGIQYLLANESFSEGTFGNGLFVFGGYSGSMRISTNGTSWTVVNPLFGGNAIFGVEFFNNQFIAVGDTGIVTVSTNGTSWQYSNTGIPTNYNIRKIIYEPDTGVYAVINGSETIYVSTNLTSWVARTAPTGMGSHSMAYGGNRWVYLQSLDNSTWRQRTTSSVIVLTPSVPFTDTYIILEYKGTTRVLS